MFKYQYVYGPYIFVQNGMTHVDQEEGKRRRQREGGKREEGRVPSLESADVSRDQPTFAKDTRMKRTDTTPIVHCVRTQTAAAAAADIFTRSSSRSKEQTELANRRGVVFLLHQEHHYLCALKAINITHHQHQQQEQR